MNVLYFHQYFKINSGGTRSYEFSKHLINRGHKVTMITGSKLDKDNIEGIKLKSTNTKYKQTYSNIRRIIAFLHFMIKSTILGLKEKDTDIIYATSTPLTIGIPALIVSKLRRINFVFEVRDVWPDVPIQLGYINSKVIQKILYLFELRIYKSATHIVVLSEGMKKNLINKGVSPDKMTVITNLSNNELFDTSLETEVKPTECDDKLICIHPGTMGVVNGLEFILDLAKQYPNENIIYYLIGEGNQKEKLIKQIEDNSIKNVLIKEALPKEEVIKEIKKSDVGIMTVADYKILEDNSANKFFDFLAAGLPVVTNYCGWQKNVLEENQAGQGFTYENKQDFYNYLVELKNNRKLRLQMGRNAKNLAITKYDSQVLSEKFLNVLLKALDKN